MHLGFSFPLIPLLSLSSSSSSSSHKPPHNTGRRKQAKPQKKPGKPEL